MKKILIVDNNIDPKYWGAKSLRRSASLNHGYTLYVRRAPHDDLPAYIKQYDGVIVSGSKTSVLEEAPWIDHLLQLVKQCIETKKPYLGICYGHQILAKALGGKTSVGKAKIAEYGWTEIHHQNNSDLMKGLPTSFYSFSAHSEEVCQLPPGTKKLAHSTSCEIQAYQLENLPLFGIQFHPEKNVEDAELVFQERKKKGFKDGFLHPSRSQELYNPQVGEMIFKNFLSQIN